jgi:hypothetical protein
MSLQMINSVIANRSIASYCPLCGRRFKGIESNAEHIFPKWLQRHHQLWTRRLTIPNFLGKSYKSVTVTVCARCNNARFGQLENVLSKAVRTADAFEAFAELPDEAIALWLGKIFWLLCQKSHSVQDYKTRTAPKPEQILPEELMPGIAYLGVFERAFANKKSMLSCYLTDPPIPEFYGPPYSLYRFKIADIEKFENFDYLDSPIVLGLAMRTGNVGFVCLFDGGLHRRFRSHRFANLFTETLHPMQFSEVAARIFFDQTVLDERAAQVTYYWNRDRRAVIAKTLSPRFYNPYLHEKFDPKLLAQFMGRFTQSDPNTLLVGDREFTRLWDENGDFLPYAVTPEDIEAAQSNPNRTVIGPADPKWRTAPPKE